MQACRSVCSPQPLEERYPHPKYENFNTLSHFSHWLLQGFLSYLEYVVGHKLIPLCGYQAWIFLNFFMNFYLQGDYEMMPVYACVVCHADFSKTTTTTDFL